MHKNLAKRAHNLGIAYNIPSFAPKGKRERIAVLPNEAITDTAERSDRSTGPGESAKRGATIKFVVFDEAGPDIVFFVSDGRLQVATGKKVRSFLGSEGHFDTSAAVLHGVPPTVDSDIRRKKLKAAKAVKKVESKRRARKR